MNEETQKLPAENKEVSKISNKNIQITKTEREAMTKKIYNLFSKGHDFSKGTMITELVELFEKKELTISEEKRKTKLENEISRANGLKNGYWVNNLSYEKYFMFLATTRLNFIDEYDCKTPIEYVLVDRIVANYWRTMQLDMTLNRLIEKEEGVYSFNDSKIYAMAELSKGLESASRQLNTSILLLKEMKQPKLNIKVTTENAFIGQNQQFNANQQANNQPNEIIKPI